MTGMWGSRNDLRWQRARKGRKLVGQGESPKDVAKLLGVSRRTVYRA
jgi:transposase